MRLCHVLTPHNATCALRLASLSLHHVPCACSQAIGEDLFAIAVDQPFRFPATFTFVLRAFSTLEGIGKTLNPSYKFSEVAKPYATELLDLQNTQSQQALLVSQLQQQATQITAAAAQMPLRIQRMDALLGAVSMPLCVKVSCKLRNPTV